MEDKMAEEDSFSFGLIPWASCILPKSRKKPRSFILSPPFSFELSFLFSSFNVSWVNCFSLIGFNKQGKTSWLNLLKTFTWKF